MFRIYVYDADSDTEPWFVPGSHTDRFEAERAASKLCEFLKPGLSVIVEDAENEVPVNEFTIS